MSNLSNTKRVRYNASSTCAEFHADNHYFRGIRGPVGSGKSSACMWELMIRAHAQEPWEGVRRTRFIIIRNTYPELKQSTIKTWQYWFPEAICPLTFDTPIRGKMIRPLADGTTVDMEVIFMAVDSPEDVQKLLSTEYTGAYINEASEIDQAVITTLPQRIGRYPATIRDDEGKILFAGPTWAGIIADTNPPSTRHWWYRYAEDETPEGFKFFVQPPGMLYDEKIDGYIENPEAENVDYLPGGFEYYRKIIAAANGDVNTISRVVCNEYGVPLHGKPVFPQFRTRLHVAKDKLRVDKSRPLIIGLDWGLNPAAVLGQQTPLGGVVLLDELTPSDESLEEFLDSYLLPLLSSKYSNMTYHVVGDPAGRGRSGLDKRTPFTVCAERNLRAAPAITNSFVPRKEAIDFFLNRTNGLLLASHLTMLREGFLGQYAYSRLIGTRDQHKPTPDKNDHSHIMDALQYFCLFVRYGAQRLSAKRVAKNLSATDEPVTKKIVKYA